MDSVTQAIAGGLIGEVTLGKQVGNKAVLWGAIIGTIPDLDVFLSPFYDDVEGLLIHRGFSHSLIFCMMLAPLIGIGLKNIYRNIPISALKWSLYALYILLVAVGIDYLTTYGASIFWPFSDIRIEISTISIVDVFFTLPLLIGLIIILFYKKNLLQRSKISRKVFLYALIYLLLTGFHKIYQHHYLISQLHQQNKNFTEIRTQPMPLTNFLWMGIAKTSNGFWFGYHSLFDKEPVNFRFIPQNNHYIAEYADNSKLNKLLRFTKKYYCVEKTNNQTILLHDLRFGKMGNDNEQHYVFTFRILPGEKNLQIVQKEWQGQIGKKEIIHYIRRIFATNTK
jgi:inner membrane protein